MRLGISSKLAASSATLATAILAVALTSAGADHDSNERTSSKTSSASPVPHLIRPLLAPTRHVGPSTIKMSHLPSGAGLKAKLKTEIETPKTGEGVTKALPGVPTTKSTAVPLQSLRPSTMHPAKTALPPVKIDGGGGGTPPDAALAVGSGFVVHAINSIIDVHHADGSHPAGYPKSAHDFWCEGDGLPGCNSGDPSDPRLVYDTSSQHFVYVTLLIRNSKAHFTWLAVSRTSDPTALWDRYAV